MTRKMPDTAMSLTIYHNPRCSKSRQTLKILRDNQVRPTIIEYLKTPPDAQTIGRLARQLDVRVADLLRTGEAEFREAADLPPLDDDEALAAWIHEHPKVLERPIVVNTDTGSAVIGRPPERVTALLDL